MYVHTYIYSALDTSACGSVSSAVPQRRRNRRVCLFSMFVFVVSLKDIGMFNR